MIDLFEVNAEAKVPYRGQGLGPNSGGWAVTGLTCRTIIMWDISGPSWGLKYPT
jgi:hypothetical protein